MSHDNDQNAARPCSHVGYKIEEVVQMLRVSRNSAYQMVARGEIPSIKVGRLVRIPVAQFHKKFGDCVPV
jgi:excisionase family DNA binding protein